MGRKVGELIKDTMGEGEKVAPVKSIKLKVKFQKKEGKYDEKKKKLAEKKK